MGAQSEANGQANAWAEQWGSKMEKHEAIKWPTHMGPMPPRLMAHAHLSAAMTFPVGTGLAWDGIPPLAICRLSNEALELLAEVIHHCEITWIWPD